MSGKVAIIAETDLRDLLNLVMDRNIMSGVSYSAREAVYRCAAGLVAAKVPEATPKTSGNVEPIYLGDNNDSFSHKIDMIKAYRVFYQSVNVKGETESPGLRQAKDFIELIGAPNGHPVPWEFARILEKIGARIRWPSGFVNGESTISYR